MLLDILLDILQDLFLDILDIIRDFLVGNGQHTEGHVAVCIVYVAKPLVGSVKLLAMLKNMITYM